MTHAQRPRCPHSGSLAASLCANHWQGKGKGNKRLLRGEESVGGSAESDQPETHADTSNLNPEEDLEEQESNE